MSATLAELRPVRVIGVGIHPYQRPSDTPYTALGVHAVRAALADALDAEAEKRAEAIEILEQTAAALEALFRR